jgi:hypothetical protein
MWTRYAARWTSDVGRISKMYAQIFRRANSFRCATLRWERDFIGLVVGNGDLRLLM